MFIKIVAAEVLENEIRATLSKNPRDKREAFFSRVVTLVKPDLKETDAHKLTSFFDPSVWDIQSIPVNSEDERLLRLAAITSAMLFQEEGIERGGANQQTFAKAIVLARKQAEGKGR